ncbi:MAG: methyltransferase [Chitinophagales bacterium]|nr:MAG: methyltransferase [Chitinophagales bacterium]
MEKDWYETWFHSPYYEALYYHRDETEARVFIDALVAFLKPAPQSRILDLACGSGRHAVYLASLGYQVTGIDLSAELIEKARSSESDKLEFFVHDMRNEFRINFYNYILNLFTSFGYFKSDHDHKRVLKNIFLGLKSGGRFVLDFFNTVKLSRTLVKHENKHIGKVQFDIQRSLEKGFVIKTIKVVHNGQTYNYLERVRAFTPVELLRLISESGLVVEEQFGSYDLQPYVPQSSDRLIIIARKPE